MPNDIENKKALWRCRHWRKLQEQQEQQKQQEQQEQQYEPQQNNNIQQYTCNNKQQQTTSNNNKQQQTTTNNNKHLNNASFKICFCADYATIFSFLKRIKMTNTSTTNMF